MKTKFSGILTLLLALVVQLTFAQQKTITGMVTDDTGLPLPGANVIIKGTSSGTQSDFDGKYSIAANVGQTLTYSYVGFDTKEVKVAAQSTIDISLNPGSALNEVVVTGYSTRNQTVQTSAVVSISASEISQLSPTTSIDNLLQGKAAGVQVTAANGKPGQGAFVRIRGVGSLNAGAASPLYIVDGAPIREEDLSNIANEDIENITILKDAATTARYGSRGANGVVIVTTKTGKRNSDAVIRYSSRYGTTSRIDPNFSMMDAAQKLRYERELAALGVTEATGLPGALIDPGTPEYNALIANQVDWQDLVLKDGVIQNNNISFSGGAEKMDYFFSVGHDKNTGIIDKIDGFERLNARVNLNFDAKEWLEIGVNVGYSRTTSDEPRDRNNSQNPFRHMLDVNPYETEFVLDEDGNITLDENGDPVYNATHTDFPVRRALETEPAIVIENTTLASIDALVKFSKNWSYNFNFAVNHLNQREEAYSYPGGVLDGFLGTDGNKRDSSRQRLDYTVSNRLNYSLRGEDHHLNVLGLLEFNQNEVNFLQVRSTGFPTSALSTQVNGTLVLQKPNSRTNRDRLTLLSYGAFAEYDYKEKYLASATIRTDGSSSFGKDVQFGTFYSGSLGWNIAKEDFFAIDAINLLKIRASYGTVGNRQGIDRYAAQDLVTFENQYPGGAATTPSNFGNSDLQWETSSVLNIGAEFNLFNNRLRGVTDYFKRNTTDLLFQVPRAIESGVDFVFGNLGEIENSGIEISLQGDIIRNQDLTWTLGGNVIFLTDSKVVSLPDGNDVQADLTTFNVRYSEGQGINEHFLVRYAGVDPATGRPQYFGADGNVYFAQDLPDDPNDNRVFQGKSTIADKEGGFFTNINYKGFGLRADFIFKAGNWINNFVKSDRVSDGLAVEDNQAVEAFNYWQQPGDTDVLPSPLYRNDFPAAADDRYLEKGDYVRMRNLTVSYNFPSKFLDKTPISTLRLYATGQNLLTFTKFFGDPEVGLSSGETISFSDATAPGEATLYSYPNTKSFQIGLDVSF